MLYFLVTSRVNDGGGKQKKKFTKGFGKFNPGFGSTQGFGKSHQHFYITLQGATLKIPKRTMHI